MSGARTGAERPPALFDRALHRRRLERAAGAEEEADFLRVRTAQDAVERLLTVNRRFPRALDLGARRGAFARALEASGEGRVDVLVQADLSHGMVRGRPLGVVVDEERLAFAPESFDLAVSLLALHWTNDLVGALIQIRLALKADGLFLGTVFGGATLTELRQCLIEADVEADGGAGPRVSPFTDALEGAGLLQRAGFALPVADVERITVRYAHPLALLRDLRLMGETSALVQGSRRPLTRGRVERMCALYLERFALPDGRVPATFDLINLSGWAPHADQPKPLPRGSAKMALGDALAVVRRSREGPET